MSGPHMPPPRHAEIRIIKHGHAEEFEAKVNHVLRNGWSLRGNIIIDGGMFIAVAERTVVSEARP